MTGLFISFEGIEGSGKSTQVQCLQAYLESAGYEVTVTREPGGTPIAEAIRGLLLDPENVAMSPTTELLLYEAARAQHVHERVRPALAAGRMVLCDRFVDSTTAYQGAGRGLGGEALERLHQLATDNLVPDLTFLLDLPADVALVRGTRSGSTPCPATAHFVKSSSLQPIVTTRSTVPRKYRLCSRAEKGPAHSQPGDRFH